MNDLKLYHQDAPAFDSFTAPLIGLPVSHVWRGNGSSLFIEFGKLHPRSLRDGSVQLRDDGSQSRQNGDWSLMIEWSWRIEGPRSIICGSWSKEGRWPRAFSLLQNATVVSARVFGRLPEIEITFSNRLDVLSFMTSNGDPAWVLFDLRSPRARWIYVRRGSLEIEEGD